MKNLRTAALCATLTLCSLFSLAQEQKVPINEPDYNKPKLFQSLPERIAFNPDNFMGLLNKQTGSVISTSLSTDSQIPFEGKIVSTTTSSDGKIQSMLMSCTNYAGATFSLTKVINDDGSVKYNGRLLSLKHGDLFVLEQTAGHFTLVKKNYYDLVNE